MSTPPEINSKEEALEIVDGTTEAEARDELGKARREMTGVLSHSSRVKFLTLSSKIMKPISIFNSALGLTISILLLTEDVFWSTTFWVSIVIGLIIGVFFELWSTNSEHAFATDDELETTDDPDKGTYKALLISIKTYAVIMVLISAWNLPDYILVQKTKNIEDNGYIKTKLKQIERLKKDKASAKDFSNVALLYQKKIDRLTKEIAEIRKEKTPELVKNSTSIYVKKRKDAQTALADITARIEAKNAEISEAEKAMLNHANSKTAKQIYEDEITALETQIEKERDRLRKLAGKNSKSTLGITIMLGVLFVLLELGGTMASILAKRTVLNSISQEEALKENITNKLFSSRVALKERNTRLKATKIVSDLEQNKTMTAIIKYESEANAQNHELLERARLAEIDRENARLLTESKLQELEANQLLTLTEGINKKLDGLDTVRRQIGKILRKDG